MPRTVATLPFLLWVLASMAEAGGAVEHPYPVQPAGSAVVFPLPGRDATLGSAGLSWSPDALVIDVRVRDATPVSLADAGVGIEEAYRADSVEFWAGRRQFVAVDTPGGGRLWDYLYARPVAGAVVVRSDADGGYRLRIEAPWAVLGVRPSAGASFQFALQINDRRRTRSADGWKESSVQTLFPDGAVWDRVSTYATVFLNEDIPVAQCAPSPCAFASIDIRSFAYRQAVEAVVERKGPFASAALVIVCRPPEGPPAAGPAVPAGEGRIVVGLPWDERRVGIFSAEVWLAVGERRYGPAAEPYVNTGPTPIAQYRSPRTPPEDLARFWTGKLAAMRAVPMEAEVERRPSEHADVIVERVRLLNHRREPMLVWVSRKTGDDGPRPAHLNVYPPMRADAPVRPRTGFLGITFCGARQGACRLPGQSRDEPLWARAEDLDDCCWLDVVLDGVRAMDYVAGRRDSDGRVVVSGGSRGGWYALALAAVAPDRVALARCTSPCYSDVTMNMKLGWSSAANEIYSTFERDRVLTGGRIFRSFQYFDPLFLAGLVRTPVVVSAGLQDHICSAAGMAAAANRMPPEWRWFILDPEAGHGGSPWAASISAAAEGLILSKDRTP